MWVVLLPCDVEHVEVILGHSDLLLLMGLVEVLEDHRDVHVDDDEERDQDERNHEEDGDTSVPTVTVRGLETYTRCCQVLSKYTFNMSNVTLFTYIKIV